MNAIEYISEADASRAIKMLNIHGPQVLTVVVKDKKNVAILWKDGSHSLVTHALFNTLVQ